MAVRSQLALAKFLGHFFTPHFYAKAVYNEKGTAEASAFMKRSAQNFTSSQLMVPSLPLLRSSSPG
jgi:hypothetical protein